MSTHDTHHAVDDPSTYFDHFWRHSCTQCACCSWPAAEDWVDSTEGRALRQLEASFRAEANFSKHPAEQGLQLPSAS